MQIYNINYDVTCGILPCCTARTPAKAVTMSRMRVELSRLAGAEQWAEQWAELEAELRAELGAGLG